MIDILIGDVRERLKELPDNSVHCAVTSPPYWGLRKYKGDPGMIGQEPDFVTHLDNLMVVFDEIWRVLRDDGTFWLNYGDAYAGSGRGHTKPTNPGISNSYERMGNVNKNNKGSHGLEPNKDGSLSLAPKNLMMMPARIAIAMQERGWILRSEIIWSKRNSLPESVKDRPTCAHEKVFLFAKRQKYFYDHVAVQTKTKDVSMKRLERARFESENLPDESAASAFYRPSRGFTSPNPDNEETDVRSDRQPMKRMIEEGNVPPHTDRSNLRNVWRLATASYKGAHFAVFPVKLVEPCIKAGTSEKGVCSECGAPLIRIADKHDEGTRAKWGSERKRFPKGEINGIRDRALDYVRYETTGWKATCDCYADIVPATVLDPFGGAGTTALVADRLQRNAIICEISDEYADIAKDRIMNDNPIAAKVNVIK